MDQTYCSNISLQLEELPAFYCKTCDFKCEEKRYLQQHFKSKKHSLAISLIKEDNKEDDKQDDNECNDLKTTNALLLQTIEDLKNDKIQQQKTIDDLLAQNKMLLQLLTQKTEQQPIIYQQPATIMQQPAKQSFCRETYLNETCKDAMNINDFINSIEITLQQYQNMEKGFADGISKNLSKIISNTKKTSLPFCCTNARDKTIWVKIDDAWIEDKQFIHINKFISKYNFKLYNVGTKIYKETYPDCIKSSSSLYSDSYNKIMINCMSENDDNNLTKVLNNILKLITIEK